MQGQKLNLILGTLFGLSVVIYSSVFTVHEWQQAIVTQFGKIIGEPVSDAGIHFKIPFIQDVRYFEKRILNWDGEPAQVPTKDKKFILVDTTARWRIVDPVKFIQTVQDEDRAMLRITSIIDGKTKTVISNYNLVETVRNTNSILDKVAQAAQDEGEEKITGEIEVIEAGREKLSELITLQARKEIDSLGVELIDVLIRRIAYEKSVESKVFDRMISERMRIAEKIRAIGKGEEAKIRGTLNLDLKTIESEAYRQAQTIRGESEAKAIQIYADAMGQDPEFFEFIRTMEAYKKSLPERANIIFGSDSKFFQRMNKR